MIAYCTLCEADCPFGCDTVTCKQCGATATTDSHCDPPADWSGGYCGDHAHFHRCDGGCGREMRYCGCDDYERLGRHRPRGAEAALAGEDG